MGNNIEFIKETIQFHKKEKQITEEKLLQAKTIQEKINRCYELHEWQARISELEWVINIFDNEKNNNLQK